MRALRTSVTKIHLNVIRDLVHQTEDLSALLLCLLDIFPLIFFDVINKRKRILSALLAYTSTSIAEQCWIKID